MSSRNSRSKSTPKLSAVTASKGKEKKVGHIPQLKRLKDTRKFDKKLKTGFKPVAKIPSTREDSSSNWKALLQKQGKSFPTASSTSTTSSSKRNMDNPKEGNIKRVRNSLDSDTGSMSFDRSRSVSEARCASQFSMASESASSSSRDNYDAGSDTSVTQDSDASRKVKQEFRALGLSQSNASQQTRPSRSSEKVPRGQQPQMARPFQEKKLKTCLPKGLNEFGFFDYSHYGALRTSITPEHAEFMIDTGIVSMDCEMVGVGPMKESALARVSIVNKHGFCLYNRFVKPKIEVTDYRTEFSGIREADLKNAPQLNVVVKEVADFLRSHILVGHSLKSDLGVLFLNHQKARMRDTAFYFKKMMHNRTPKLKTLVKRILGIDIQQGEHSSITDAQAAMALYLVYQKEWETSVRQSNRGVDVLKECLEEFKELQHYKFNSTTQPPPPTPELMPPQPSTSPSQQENWYGCSVDSSFCEEYYEPQLSIANVADVDVMPLPYPIEQMPLQIPQMNYPQHACSSTPSFTPPLENFPPFYDPVPPVQNCSQLYNSVQTAMNCAPLYGPINVTLYQPQLPLPMHQLQPVPMQVYPLQVQVANAGAGFPGMVPPQQHTQFMPTQAPPRTKIYFNVDASNPLLRLAMSF